MAICVGNEVYSDEVQRWCPDKQFFAHSQHQLPSGQANVIEVKYVTCHNVRTECIKRDDLACQNFSTFCTRMLAMFTTAYLMWQKEKSTPLGVIAGASV